MNVAKLSDCSAYAYCPACPKGGKWTGFYFYSGNFFKYFIHGAEWKSSLFFELPYFNTFSTKKYKMALECTND